MAGPAWSELKAAADGKLGKPEIADQDSNHDVRTLAVALAYARTGEPGYRAKAAGAVLAAIPGTEQGDRTLALGRNLIAYIIAADLIDLKGYDPAGEQRFREWLAGVRYANLDGRTLISTHEKRPNNWARMPVRRASPPTSTWATETTSAGRPGAARLAGRPRGLRRIRVRRRPLVAGRPR